MLRKNVTIDDVDEMAGRYLNAMKHWGSKEPYSSYKSSKYREARSEFLAFCQALLCCGEEKLVKRLEYQEKELQKQLKK